MNLYFETFIPLSVEIVKNNFTQELFLYLAPPFVPFHLKKFDGCKEGDIVRIDLGVWPMKQEWESLITKDSYSDQGWLFVDEGKKLPFPLSYWHHSHRVEKIDEKSCRIIDDINFSCKPQFINPLMKPILYLMFFIRPKRYQKFFQGKK